MVETGSFMSENMQKSTNHNIYTVVVKTTLTYNVIVTTV